jgi:hypothetical protein
VFFRNFSFLEVFISISQAALTPRQAIPGISCLQTQLTDGTTSRLTFMAWALGWAGNLNILQAVSDS